jgi:hypothetical protein
VGNENSDAQNNEGCDYSFNIDGKIDLLHSQRDSVERDEFHAA